MSSFKNMVRRREHRERAQPEARARFGLLEKHKDYVQRARNFHDKEKRLLNLTRKAQNRNPDEFYFAMNRSAVKGGVHRAGASVTAGLDPEQLAAMKSQDIAYLQTKTSAELKKIQRLEATLHLAAGAGTAVPRNHHIKFVDSAVSARDSPARQAGETAAVGAGNDDIWLLEEEDSAAPVSAPPASQKQKKQAQHMVEKSYAELEERKARAARLTQLAGRLRLLEELRKPGPRKKIAGKEGGPPVYKWKPMRKK